MGIVFNPKNINSLDILCKVYENQTKENETEQICVDIYYNPHKMNGRNDIIRKKCRLPRNAANIVGQEIKQFKGSNRRIGISNELNPEIGMLTNCDENFRNSMEQEIRIMV